MRYVTHHPTWWLAIALASVVTACGASTVASPSLSGSMSAAPSSVSTLSPSGTGPLLTGTITVRGAYPETDTFSTRAEVETGGSAAAAPAGFTCADYARGIQDPGDDGAATFATPKVQTAGSVNVHFTAAIDSGYAGPGMYNSGTLHSLTGSMVVSVGSDPGGGFYDFFRSLPPGMSILTVSPDGAGTLSYTDWFSTASDSHISGTVAWTCADRS